MASPYNPQNVALQRDHVVRCILAARNEACNEDSPEPRDLGLYQRAFVHKAYIARNHEQWLAVNGGHERCPPAGCMPLQPESNERLEWLGDSVLQLLVTELLLQRNPEVLRHNTIGRLSSARCHIVNNVSLGRLMLDLGWHRFVVLDANLERMGGRRNLELLADCFEALVGALYTDLGHAACRRWLAALLGEGRLGPAAVPVPEAAALNAMDA